MGFIHRDYGNQVPLSHAEIMRKAPSVFAVQPFHEVSDKYQFIPTTDILNTLESQGWQCTAAAEHSVRNFSKKGFQKHLLRFMNPSLPKIGDSTINLLYFNSHDRTTGSIFQAGMFREICANGLVIGSDLFSPIRVKHIGAKAENFIEASYRVIDSIPQITGKVDEMMQVKLNDDEKLYFAQSALVARFGMPEQGEIIDYSPHSILRPNRKDDAQNDLWSVFNVVQENLIKGKKYAYNANRQYTKALRPVKSITESTKLNSALWTLAESMKQIKAA